MACFKTPQFQIIAATINRCSTHLNGEKYLRTVYATIANGIINYVVDELCIEFAKDNPLFNETLFRAQCGEYVSKENANG